LKNDNQIVFYRNISSQNRVIDLRSDTVTKPCDRMREAIANAQVGDDVFGEDPTVKGSDLES